MPRQQGSISAGYTPPPTPPSTELMIYETVADYNPGKVNSLVSPNQNPGTWMSVLNNAFSSTVPVAGIVNNFICSTVEPVANADLILVLYCVRLGGVFTMDIPTSAEGQGPINAPVTLIAGDQLFWILLQAGDDNAFSIQFTFTPS